MTFNFKKIFSFPFIALIKIYQYVISPFLPTSCRYSPSCSTYATQSFLRHGPIKGFFLSFRRIIWCNPWGGHGKDPVPEHFFFSRKTALKKAQRLNYANYLNFKNYFKTLKYHTDETP
ncbi:MAG TPA: membrane protein insertion efficiency factor YidD [Bacteroidales bacterium]|nr:membrane protein insertion efficiency factor YidD [Bacteroidales bacterium]